MPATHENFSLDLHKINEAKKIALLTERMVLMGWDKKRQLMDEMLDVYLKHISGEAMTNAESPPPAPATSLTLDYQQFEDALYNAGRRLGISIQVGTNGNGHHAEPEPEEEIGFDPNDDLVKRLANPQFDEF